MEVIRERAEDGQNTSLCSLDRPLATTALEESGRHRCAWGWKPFWCIRFRTSRQCWVGKRRTEIFL